MAQAGAPARPAGARARWPSSTDEELTSLPVLYRSTLSSLATARAISLDQALQDYLEGLCTRAYFVVYGVRTHPAQEVGRFFAFGWPRAVRDLWRETLAAAAILILGWVAAYLLVSAQPDWFAGMMPGGMAEGRTPDADPATLRHALYGEGKSGLAIFSSFAVHPQCADGAVRLRAGLRLLRAHRHAGADERRRRRGADGGLRQGGVGLAARAAGS